MRTHGLSKTVEYRTWRGMLDRCHNPRHTHYKSYGGRGIFVCAEWQGAEGFLRFYAYMGERPSERYSIDRIDGNRGYEPGNVRWATRATQLANRRPVAREHYARLGAKASLRSGGKLWTMQATDELCRGIRDELEERFGPAPRRERMLPTTVEQAFVEHDYSAESFHFEGLENIRHCLPKAKSRYSIGAHYPEAA